MQKGKKETCYVWDGDSCQARWQHMFESVEVLNKQNFAKVKSSKVEKLLQTRKGLKASFQNHVKFISKQGFSWRCTHPQLSGNLLNALFAWNSGKVWLKWLNVYFPNISFRGFLPAQKSTFDRCNFSLWKVSLRAMRLFFSLGPLILGLRILKLLKEQFKGL